MEAGNAGVDVLTKEQIDRFLDIFQQLADAVNDLGFASNRGVLGTTEKLGMELEKIASALEDRNS